MEPYNILEANDVFESLYVPSHIIPLTVLPIVTYILLYHNFSLYFNNAWFSRSYSWI